MGSLPSSFIYYFFLPSSLVHGSVTAGAPNKRLSPPPLPHTQAFSFLLLLLLPNLPADLQVLQMKRGGEKEEKKKRVPRPLWRRSNTPAFFYTPDVADTDLCWPFFFIFFCNRIEKNNSGKSLSGMFYMVSAEKIVARSDQERNTALQKLLNLFPAGDKNLVTAVSATEALCFDSSSQDIHDPARTNYCDFLSSTCRQHIDSLLDRFCPVPGGSVGSFTADIDPPQ